MPRTTSSSEVGAVATTSRKNKATGKTSPITLLTVATRTGAAKSKSPTHRAKPYHHAESAKWFDQVEKGLATGVEVHASIVKGLSSNRARVFLNSFRWVPKDLVLHALGVSARTLQRAIDKKASLGVEATDRATRLAETRAKAQQVFGDAAAAERWLVEPSVSLDGAKPIELLATSSGTELVKTYLQRVDRGVYV